MYSPLTGECITFKLGPPWWSKLLKQLNEKTVNYYENYLFKLLGDVNI